MFYSSHGSNFFFPNSVDRLVLTVSLARGCDNWYAPKRLCSRKCNSRSERMKNRWRRKIVISLRYSCSSNGTRRFRDRQSLPRPNTGPFDINQQKEKGRQVPAPRAGQYTGARATCLNLFVSTHEKNSRWREYTTGAATRTSALS